MRSPSAGLVEDSYSAHFHLRLSGSTTDCALPAEGLRMSLEFSHQPVLLNEVVRVFADLSSGVIIDCTLGGAGHASTILASNLEIKILGIDQDVEALEHARSVFARWPGRAEATYGRFDQVKNIHGGSTFHSDPVVGVLFDLGVSSYQFDAPERGFSYRFDAPLDMRMDRTGVAVTGAEYLNGAAEKELTSLFKENGETRFAARIARNIVANRPIVSTFQLAEVVKEAIPAFARRSGGHPAKRVFQAVRTAVNSELPVLAVALDESMQLLAPGGRIAVISYQSGEDRIVKSVFRDASTGGCSCPPGLPCGCGAIPTFRLLNRGAIKPGNDEMAINPRSASARMRVAEKLSNPQGGGANVA